MGCIAAPERDFHMVSDSIFGSAVCPVHQHVELR